MGLIRSRHNKILGRLANAVPASKGIKILEQVVPGDTLSLRPDLVILNEARSEAFVVDVTDTFEGEEAFQMARRAKKGKVCLLETPPASQRFPERRSGWFCYRSSWKLGPG